ncbi:MAG: hypothetical protein J6S74_01460 [Alphaproteobacteria bacterium]|nr:hypothetical protein [Alphaproteobacteria bacterium]
MTNEVAEFNKATKRILEAASKIDNDFMSIVDVQYPLVDIANVLRKKYLDPHFRNKYVGSMTFNGTVPYAKGFCALSAICIYNLYGGDEIWEPSAIKLGAWEYAPVVFLRERMHNRAFDTTGDQFAPLIVPYDVGTPINKRIQDMKTPNKSMFIREIINELNR